MFCPLENRFDLKTFLGEGVDVWLTPPSLPQSSPQLLLHGTQYLKLIKFPRCSNKVTNSSAWCFTDSCSRCPIYLLGSKTLFQLIELCSLISDEEMPFGKKNRMWSWAYLSREWKAASYFKSISDDRGVSGLPLKPALRGALCFVLLVAFQLWSLWHRSCICILPLGASLWVSQGSLGLRKIQLRGTVCIEDACFHLGQFIDLPLWCFSSQVYRCLVLCVVVPHLHKSGVVKSTRRAILNYGKERCSGQKTKMSPCHLVCIEILP